MRVFYAINLGIVIFQSLLQKLGVRMKRRKKHRLRKIFDRKCHLHLKCKMLNLDIFLVSITIFAGRLLLKI